MSELLELVNQANAEELKTLISRARLRLSELVAGEPAGDDEIENIASVYLNSKDVWENDIATVYDGGKGLLVIPSLIVDRNKTGAHDCIQSTISESSETGGVRSKTFWIWDEEAPTYRFAKTVKIGGERRTIAVHQLLDGSVVSFHERMKSSTTIYHERKKSTSFEISLDSAGDIDMNPVPMEWNNLPLPPEAMNQ